MHLKSSQQSCKAKSDSMMLRPYDFLVRRSYSVILLGALFCNIAAKFFYAQDNNLLDEYTKWILDDIAVILGIEIIVSTACFLWPRKMVIRTALILAAIICTWSVMNAGWLIRTGSQILPMVLIPLFRDPLNALSIIGVNLMKMPATAVILLGPSAFALVFFFSVLAKPARPDYNRKHFLTKTLLYCILILAAVLARNRIVGHGSPPITSVGLNYNCQLKAITSLIFSDSGRIAHAELEKASRKIPAFDQIQISLLSNYYSKYNIVLVVLEGIQYRHTSLYNKEINLTPYMMTLANQGVEFTNTRTSVTHTTKALFSLLTGRWPSVSQDLAEAVPATKPYASLATILKQNLNFRTAFFQSAKGNFEARPALVDNLGFDKFWSRDDSNDPNSFIGYLGSDEFSMLEPIAEWIKSDTRPFFLTILCSVTHDPYEMPEWFGKPAGEPVQRYRQAISYTDRFIEALDITLAGLNLADRTIFCTIGDHGEAFGEHGLSGHERIAFEEVLRIPWVIRAPLLIEPQTKIAEPVSLTDLIPTLLALLGFDTNAADFDGTNVLGSNIKDRKVFFAGWMQESPAGFVQGNYKFTYYPTADMVSVYDLSADPYELVKMELKNEQSLNIKEEIINWRKNSIFKLDQQRNGKKVLYDKWLCRWNNRVSSAKYLPKSKN